jgi:hypothetical protein
MSKTMRHYQATIEQAWRMGQDTMTDVDYGYEPQVEE